MTSYSHYSSPVRADYHDLSSPDPLGDSSGEDIATMPTTRRMSAAAMHKRRKSSDIDLEVSPPKLVTEQSLSPWRIKVTVEAEPEQEEHEVAVGGRTRTFMKTMKVPLRDEGAPTKVTKSKGGAKKTGRKSASPGRAPRPRRQSVSDLNILPLGDESEGNEWDAKPKSPQRRRRNKSQGTEMTTTAATSGRPAPRAFDIREDEGLADLARDDAMPTVEDGSPELKDIDVNQVATRMRSNSTKTNDTDKTSKSRPVSRRTVSMNSAMSYPTPSPTASEHGRSDDHDQAHHGFEQPEIGLDTMIESEGFTMIDLDSLPSIKQIRNTPDYPSIPEDLEDDGGTQKNQEIIDHEVSNVAPIAPCIAVTDDDTATLDSSELPSSPPSSITGKKKTYSIAHLQLPSSTNVQRHRLVTPMPVDHNPYSSPKLPSPPRAPLSVVKDRPEVHSDQAVEAGEALKEAVVVAPEAANQIHSKQSQEEGALFGGFSSSVRRELRAELRFGEKLGRKQDAKEKEKQHQHQHQHQHHVANVKPVRPDQPQVWRGEMMLQDMPPVVERTQYGKKAQNDTQAKTASDSNENAFTAGQARLQQKMQDERQLVVEQAKKNGAMLIESQDNDDEQEEAGNNDLDETMGDIWLAEARKTSSSPEESERRMQDAKHVPAEQPRRKMIPSPWKRGKQIDVSALSGDESFSGLFWRQTSTPGARFGDTIVANPERAGGNEDAQPFNHQADEGNAQTTRLGSRQSPQNVEDSEEEDDSQDIQDENFDEARADLDWRSAEDVIEAETDALEEKHEAEDVQEHEPAATRLYETNLEDVPEQDLSSSPHTLHQKIQQRQDVEHDSTYSSISDSGTVEIYRQRISLSPSKERPTTPKSALKGGRASFGIALNYDNRDKDEANARRVVWAKRSNCVNEHWEESTRSVRSVQESSSLDDTPTPIKESSQGIEASFEVQPQPPELGHQQGQSKSWFGWFKKDNSAADPQQGSKGAGAAQEQSHPVHGLDGSLDGFIKPDDYTDSEASYKPTSRHGTAEARQVDTRQRSRPSILSTYDTALPTSNNNVHLSHVRASSSRDQCLLQSKPNKNKIPSYLSPPSYPSDPTRDASVPLSTSGTFTNTHFRTLNIIYKKSTRSRFHAPAYPDEIRPNILSLVEQNWCMGIDESATMGEDGMFEFSVGATEARVLERFMREIEHGYHEKDVSEVNWTWTVKELATRLGRIAIGERVREEEKAVEGILRSARKTR